MKTYNPKQIEPKWRKVWEKRKLYQTNNKAKKKAYVLDMFPYPSGDGLHVGHPKGYIATDVYSRMKRMQGYDILHPMGWDAFGLPAENYALAHKVHPRVAVTKNIKRFKSQLEKIGFNYDWSREINTTDPAYYKWTQWIFREMFNRGLAYESNEPINWCPSCKTGLANEDVEDGKCERCGTAVEKKPLRQWVLRITDYADRLLEDLDALEWPEHIKQSQREWIGRSEGAEIRFDIKDSADSITVFTTRPDTLFGVTYVVLAPEHSLVKHLAEKAPNRDEIDSYVRGASKKSEIERTADDKEKTGVKIEGVVAVHPLTGKEIPVWVADYVLANYGTGAVMAVPAHDTRDMAFAKRYGLPVVPVILKSTEESYSYIMGVDEKSVLSFGGKIVEKTKNDFFKVLIPYSRLDEYKSFIRQKLEPGFWNEFSTKDGFYFIFKHKDGKIEEMVLNEETNDLIDRYGETFNGETAREIPENVYSWVAKNDFYEQILIHTDAGVMINSREFNGMTNENGARSIVLALETRGKGKRRVAYKLRDWVFSRQRYWGEPIPLVHCEHCYEEAKLLGAGTRSKKFSRGELMNPGWVAVPEKNLPVELPNVKSYEPSGTGESPLATISKFVKTKCPKCGGPAKRETNTMPQWAGSSWYYLRYIDPKNKKTLIDKKLEKKWMPVDMYVGGAEHATRHLIYARFWHKFLLDIGIVNTKEPFSKLANLGLILGDDGRKMSKRWGNVINPDDIVASYGADTLRLYEMFMGPFENAIAWNTESMIGCRRFIERVWRMQERVSEKREKNVASSDIDVIVNQTIKKVGEDILAFKFNTAVSAMMILANELEGLQKIPREYFVKFVGLLAPFVPHVAEEIWQNMGGKKSVHESNWPEFDAKKMASTKVKIAVQINGKTRALVHVDSDASQEQVEDAARGDKNVSAHLAGVKVERVVFVKGRILSFVTRPIDQSSGE